MDSSEAVEARARGAPAPWGGRARLALEFTLLYLGPPALFWWRPELIRGLLIPTLLTGSLAAVLWLRRDPDFDRRLLWNAAGARRVARSVLVRFALLAPALGLCFALLEPERLLEFPRDEPLVWVLVCLLYPALSVYPQEVLFRTFPCHRYGVLFPSERGLVAATAVAYAAAHAFFGNWIAPVLSLLGGLFFARTYLRSGSTLAACLEHALWGDFLFTLGLGWYFYTGSIGA